MSNLRSLLLLLVATLLLVFPQTTWSANIWQCPDGEAKWHLETLTDNTVHFYFKSPVNAAIQARTQSVVDAWNHASLLQFQVHYTGVAPTGANTIEIVDPRENEGTWLKKRLNEQGRLDEELGVAHFGPDRACNPARITHVEIEINIAPFKTTTPPLNP